MVLLSNHLVSEVDVNGRDLGELHGSLQCFFFGGGEVAALALVPLLRDFGRPGPPKSKEQLFANASAVIARCPRSSWLQNV